MVGDILCYIRVGCIQGILNKDLVDSYRFIYNTFNFGNKNLVEIVEVIIFYSLKLETIHVKRVLFVTLK